MADPDSEIHCQMCGRLNPASVATCPDCGEPSPAAPPGPGDRIFRDGPLLVIANYTSLPMICPLTNEPAQTRLEVLRDWHPRWVYFLLLFPCLYFLAVFFVQHTVCFSTGVSPQVLSRRRRDTYIVTVPCLLVACFAYLTLAVNAPQLGPLGLIVTGVFFVTHPLWLAWEIRRRLPSHKILTVHSVEKHWVRLAGCVPGYLHRFPDWAERRSSPEHHSP
jgi:hypothetical protein